MKTNSAKKRPYVKPIVSTLALLPSSTVLLACTNQVDCYGDGTCCAPDVDACVLDCP